MVTIHFASDDDGEKPDAQAQQPAGLPDDTEVLSVAPDELPLADEPSGELDPGVDRAADAAPEMAEGADRPAPATEIPLDAELAQAIAAARAAAESAREGRAFQLPLPDDAMEQATVFPEPIGAPRPTPLAPPLGSHHTSSDFTSPPVEPFGEASAGTDTSGAPASSLEPGGRTGALLSRTADSGPPLARPIVMVMLPEEQTRKIVNEILEAASKRDTQMIGEVAEATVYDAFWDRDCQERAIMGDF